MVEEGSKKLYYRIGEIAGILNVNASVLRFWETQFPLLSPRKTRTGQRLYSSRELELLEEIKRLLYVEKLTIAGAVARVSSFHKGNSCATLPPDLIGTVTRELKELRKLLE